MNGQLSLLNEPRARATDAVTSVLAAKAMRPGAGDLEAAIVEVVRAARRPVTAEYIAHEITSATHRWDHGGIVSAVSRASKAARIHPAGYGLTSRNRSAVTYRSAP